jgi:hypothetical protein
MTNAKPSKKAIPAVFFQKRLNGASDVKADPERLTLFEEQLAKVVGGIGGYTGTMTSNGAPAHIDDYAD